MKSSQFNVFLRSSNQDECILYNTLTGAVFAGNEAARSAIENADTANIPAQLLQTLQRDGILLDNHVDETAIYKVMRDQMKYSTNVLRFVIIPTFDCNLACTYCYVAPFWHGKSKPESMDVAVAERVTRFMIGTAQRSAPDEIIVDFTGGGEPLLAVETITYILREIRNSMPKKDVALRVNVITNGTLVRPELVETLSDFDICFQVTVDGPPHIHDAKRRFKDGTGSYWQIVGGLRALRDKGCPFVIRVNVARDNLRHVNRLLEELRGKLGSGLPVRFLPVLASSDSHSGWAASCLQRDELSILPELWEMAQQLGYRPCLRPLLNLLPCPTMARSAYVLDSLGHVYMCEAYAGMEAFRAATINTHGELTEPNYLYYEWMAYDPLDGAECRTCPLLPACGGECPAVIHFRTGKLIPSSCPRNKRVIEANLRQQLMRFGLVPPSS